jgi:hypothetical protein
MYHFLQLGAGTSLPGLVAAKVGADVTLTDIAQNAEVSSNPSLESLSFDRCQRFSVWLISFLFLLTVGTEQHQKHMCSQ